MMKNRFRIPEVISAINNFLENRKLRQKDPESALGFVDQLKKMEVWFIGKVFIDNSRFMREVVDLCQNGRQNDVRKFMAFVRYSFREIGPERFEDCINRSRLTSREKLIIIRFFRIGEIDHALAHHISDAADAGHNGVNATVSI